MPNYAMKFGVSEVAQILHVEKETVKTWAYTFSAYLTSRANPPKGHIRQFSINDIRVFAYVLTYWEDDPDIEHIKYGLNANDHYDYPFNEVVSQATPLFIEPPEDLGESWKNGLVFGGLSEFGDRFMLADSYKLAGDRLIDIALSNGENYELLNYT